MSNIGKLRLFLFAAVIALMVTSRVGFSQNVYGTIAGAVTDSSGAAVANATVTLTNLDTAQTRNIVADSSGNYSFPNVLPGRYKVEC